MIAFYGPNHPFSNMYEFLDLNDEPQTVEKHFQLCKAQYFGDEEVEQLIWDSTCPKEAKKLGRTVVPFDAKEWEKVRDAYMYELLWTKAYSCSEFFEMLIQSGDEKIVEAAPRDTYWGNGLGKERTLKGEIRGRNKLGELLEKLRDALIRRHSEREGSE